MAERNNATCSICGKGYYVCLACRDSIEAAPYKIHTDTSEHYKVFQIVRGYNTGVYTKDEAKAKFKNVDLSDLNEFRPHIKLTIENIINEPVMEIVEDIINEPAVEVVEDTVIDETESIAVEEESIIIEKTVAPRKKNYKVKETE